MAGDTVRSATPAGPATASAQRLAAALDGCSLEATLPKAGEIADLGRYLPAGSAVYLSALPRAAVDRQIRAAVRLRQAGYEPVPHVAARRFDGEDALARYLERMTTEAAVERVLVIGGDTDIARGPFASSHALLTSAAFRDSGIRQVGIAGYPEGHPAMDADELRAALEAKLEIAAGLGLELHIVTQFCFAARPVADWLAGLDARGIDLPVRIGLAGPASAATLLRFALRCGVDLPVRKANIAAQLLAGVSPDILIRELMPAAARYPGPLAYHLYSFGGLARTAAWLHATRAAATPVG